ncbi:MAG: hypothetical protein ABJC04_10505, partial [Verrucomicrobiota bacterium]
MILLVAVLILVFAVWRINLATKVETQLKAVRAAGLPANGKEADEWYAAVPDVENSALLMGDAINLMQAFPDGRSNEVSRIKFPTRPDSLTEDQKNLVSDYLELNEAAINKVNEAIQWPKARYPIDLSFGLETPLPHLSHLKELGRIAQFKSLLASDSEESTEAIRIILGTARTLEAEPVLISQLVRVALINMAVLSLEQNLNNFNFGSEQLFVLASAFSASEKTNLMMNALIAERASNIPYFRMSNEELHYVTPQDEMTGSVARPLKGIPAPFLKISGAFERDLLFYLQTMATNIFMLKQGPPESLKMVDNQKQVEVIVQKNFYLLSSLFLPALGKISQREADAFAFSRMASAALAVEQFRAINRRLPESLCSGCWRSAMAR